MTFRAKMWVGWCIGMTAAGLCFYLQFTGAPPPDLVSAVIGALVGVSLTVVLWP